MEWTEPTSDRLSQLLTWLQLCVNEHHEAPRVEADNYREFARGLAADLLFNFEHGYPERPDPNSPNPYGIMRDEDIYWRCVAICSTAWVPAPELWERNADCAI